MLNGIGNSPKGREGVGEGGGNRGRERGWGGGGGRRFGDEDIGIGVKG